MSRLTGRVVLVLRAYLAGPTPWVQIQAQPLPDCEAVSTSSHHLYQGDGVGNTCPPRMIVVNQLMLVKIQQCLLEAGGVRPHLPIARDGSPGLGKICLQGNKTLMNLVPIRCASLTSLELCFPQI